MFKNLVKSLLGSQVMNADFTEDQASHEVIMQNPEWMKSLLLRVVFKVVGNWNEQFKIWRSLHLELFFFLSQQLERYESSTQGALCVQYDCNFDLAFTRRAYEI